MSVRPKARYCRRTELTAIGLSLAAFASALYIAYSVGQYATELSPDEGNYIAMAERLLAEHVYSFWGEGPDAYVSPGYPLFLTLCFALFGCGPRGLAVVRVLQCALAGVTVYLTFRLGRALTKRGAAGLTAALLVACNGGFYFFSRMILTETLYFFLMLLSFVLITWARESNGSLRFLAAGLCFGAAVMVRSLIVVVLPFLALPRLVQRRRDRSISLMPIWMFFAGFLVLCLPWWLRNAISLHRLVLWATQTNPVYAGIAADPVALGLSDPGSYLGNFRLLLGLLIQDPMGTLRWLSFEKFRIIFLSDVVMPKQIISEIVRNLTVNVGLCGAALGFAARRTRLATLPFWVYFLCIFFSVPSFRYAYQYLPILAIFAAWLLTAAQDAITCR